MLFVLAFLSLQAAVREIAGPADAIVVVAQAETGRLLAHHRLEEARTRQTTPGSTLKPFTLLALLEQNKLNAETRLACEPHLRLAGLQLDCSHPVTARPLGPAEALAYSCNSYFSRMALRLERRRFQESLRQAGFQTAAESSTDDLFQLQALGEAGVSISPLGVLRAYRRLASMAVATEPRYRLVFEGLMGATAYGSAQLAGLPGLSVAGKTGTTANIARTGTHAWFAGYAPAENPSIVVVVFVEQGRGGSTAAPMAGAIMRAWAEGR